MTKEGLYLNVCGDCELKGIDFSGPGFDTASQVLIGLSDQNGEGIPSLSEQQLEGIRKSEINEWHDVQGSSSEAAKMLTTMPEVVAANYHCDRRRALGQCMLDKI